MVWRKRLLWSSAVSVGRLVTEEMKQADGSSMDTRRSSSATHQGGVGHTCLTREKTMLNHLNKGLDVAHIIHSGCLLANDWPNLDSIVQIFPAGYI